MQLMWQWLSNLQGAQSGLVGSFSGFVFGVVALILGALFNFRLNRRRDALLRSEEADAVSAALYSEVILLRQELARTAILIARRIKNGQSFDERFLEIVRLQDPMLLKALANKIGILDPELILALTDFYSKVELVRAWLPDIIEREGHQASHPLSVLEPAVQALEEVNWTLATLAKRLKVLAPEKLDIGIAQAIVEMQKQTFLPLRNASLFMGRSHRACEGPNKSMRCRSD